MHLLNTTTGVIDGAAEAVDLRQDPADIVILSAADSELSMLARAYSRLEEPRPTLRLANILQLQHNFSVDLYIQKTLVNARLIVLRLLGGESYWSYGLSEIKALARHNKALLAVLPGDAHPDSELTAHSTLPASQCERLRRYLVAGGQENAERFLAMCGHVLGSREEPAAASPLPKAGIYRQECFKTQPLVGIIFYGSVLEGAQTEPVDHLFDALMARGLGCVAIYLASLKDAVSTEVVTNAFSSQRPDVIINMTSFTATSGDKGDPLKVYECPVLQAVLSGSTEESWRASSQGFGPRDLAMNVVLPEMDGRILSRAISFKTDDFLDEPRNAGSSPIAPCRTELRLLRILH